ncbi:uncharacterized protein LOC106172706 [Lingula anatina]|uniref:Uncharacterized protein LOC106172706 n=1 Tax=Lingula anatina TaxID=7574 RepID=A0A1S3JEX9_LINAN|nr:uncharacterized protein LOC106172706 [Lingula anatina]|eukprot:XP_013408970.1 uncharacterized protein LOC106172706 [Lingula anatina]
MAKMGFEIHYIIQIHAILLIIYSQSTGEHNGPCFKELPPSVVERHLKISRHLPLCLLYRRSGEGSELENKLCQFWKKRDRKSSYSHWEVGAYAANVAHNLLPQLELPRALPTLRCHLGHAQPFEFSYKPKYKYFKRWFEKLAEFHSDQLQEATVSAVGDVINKHQLVVVGFSDETSHYDMENLLFEVRNKFEGIKVLFVHPHSLEARSLVRKCGNPETPAIVIVKNDSESLNPKVIKTISMGFFAYEQIGLTLMAQSTSAMQITKENIKQHLLQPSTASLPALVLFYAPWSNTSLQYMYAFQKTMQDLTDLNARIQFGLVDFKEQPHRNKPNLIKQTPLYERPTPDAISRFLEKMNLKVLINDKIREMYKPYVQLDAFQICEQFEGPIGTMCSSLHHNQTEHTPRIYKVHKRKIVKKSLKSKHKVGWDWHTKFGSETVEKKMKKVNDIPVVTSEVWSEVIEKSHAPLHPYISGEMWRGEVTKVTLVIFIIADCKSCTSNMNTFAELQKAVKFIDGGSAYLANCTSDPSICEQHEITGFPTLVAFRGIGWLAQDQCVSHKSSKRAQHVRMDYHGVLLVPSVMEWFSSVSTTAVKNKGHAQMFHFSMPEDVYLVGQLAPKNSQFLPFIPKKRSGYFYPYECFRLACEQLYGRSGCYTQYSDEIPPREFEDLNQDMVVTKVMLYRKDGVKASIMELGYTLHSRLEKEKNSKMHQFHTSHRYEIPQSLKCEENHAVCTDLIVSYAEDHARLPVTRMTTAAFHSKNSIVANTNLPILVALVDDENGREDSKFLKSLTRAASELYQDIVVVTVNVNDHSAWASHFVPKDYKVQAMNTAGTPSMYVYPRLCLIQWQDHHHAAFYPPPSDAARGPTKFTKTNIVQFVRQVLRDMSSQMVETEHF